MTTAGVCPGKTNRTKMALIHAARELVIERGHERISIQDITQLAGVATGTFYNYFETKQDVFIAVLEAFREAFELEANQIRERLADPAMCIAQTLKFYFEQAQDNEAWNTFLTYSGLPQTSLYQRPDQCFEDIKRGTMAGRFKVDDIDFTQSLITGMVKHTNTQISTGKLSRTAMENTTRYILRMLGLPDLVAKALAQSPLPASAAPKSTQKSLSKAIPMRPEQAPVASLQIAIG